MVERIILDLVPLKLAETKEGFILRNKFMSYISKARAWR